MKHVYTLLLLIALTNGALISQPCNEPPAAENCLSAPLICDMEILNGYCTSLTDQQTGNGPTPMCDMGQGGVPNNPLWMAFYAGCTTLNLTISASNCVTFGGSIGIQAAIYGYNDPEGCPNTYQTPDEYIACVGYCPMIGDELQLTANYLEIGRVYYLMIDGCAGSYCDISISISGICGDPVIDEWTLDPLTGPDTVCTGSMSTYEIASPLGAIFHHWYLDSVLVQDGPFNSFAIQWTVAGTYQLCVDVSNACVPESADPAQQCITVTVTDIPAIDPDPVTICANDTYAYGGKNYLPGIHQVNLPSSSDCDSIVTLTVNSSPVKETNLGTFFLCASDTLWIANSAVTCGQTGYREIILQQSTHPYCDSILRFFVQCISVDAAVEPPPIFSTGADSIILDGTNSMVFPPIFPAFFDWYHADTTSWTWVGDSVIQVVYTLGTYCLVVTGTSLDSQFVCMDTFCVKVDSVISSIQPVSPTGIWTLSPNPAHDILWLTCSGDNCPGEGMIECWDAIGRKLESRPIQQWAEPVQLSVTHWPPGTYWMTWTGPGGQRMMIGKAVVQR